MRTRIMGMLLDFFWDEYHREYQLEDTSAETYRSAIAMFERWYQDTTNTQLNWRTVNHKLINDWLIWLGDGRSSHTVKSRKLSLMAVLNTARRRNLCQFDNDRIRKVRAKSNSNIDFWSIDEVQQLAAAAESLKGRFRATQIRKDYFAKAYVLTVWDTALRRGDMAILKASTIDATLEFAHPRVKTGVSDICRINQETYRWIQMTYDQYNSSRKLVFPPWQKGRNKLRPVSDLFAKLMLAARLRASDSCLKKLVRSSIMEADSNAPGTGWLQGHHSDPKTTFQAYANRQRCNLNRPKNRELQCRHQSPKSEPPKRSMN